MAHNVLKKNHKCDLLILDNSHSNINFKNLKFEYEDFRNLNIYYFFFAILKYFFFNNKRLALNLVYKKIILESYEPKIILDHWLTGNIKDIKKVFPKVKIIIYE